MPRTGLSLLLAVTLAVGAVAVPSLSRAECPPFPETRWWDNLSHESTRRYVNFKHQGDWAPYLEKWRSQLTVAKRIHASGKAAALPRTGIRIEGEELRKYVEGIENRIKVIECLSKEPGAAPAPRAPEPEIQAAKPEKKGLDRRHSTFTATVSVPKAEVAARGDWEALSVSVTVQCDLDATRFVLTNKGELWPQPADLTVLHRRQGNVMAERKLRMTAGQTFSLRAEGGGPMELRIAAPWIKGDARIVQTRCD